MLDFSPRTYHFAFVNDVSYCLTEQYRYNKFGECKLDILFIEENKGQISKLASMYKLGAQKMYEYDQLKKITKKDIHDELGFDVDSYSDRIKKDEFYKPKNLREKKAAFISQWFGTE